jgi:hypothetical protein
MSCIRGITLVTAFALCVSTNSQGALIPVIDNFDDNVADGFVNVSGSGAVWSTTGGAHQLQITSGASGSTSSSLVQITNDVAALGVFVFETNVQIPAYASTGVNGIDIGVVALSEATTNVNGGRYLFDFNPTKQTVRIVGFDVAPAAVPFTFSTSETYHLRIEGDYTGGTLNAIATFTDPSLAPIVFNVSDTTPITGVLQQGWGYRARTGASTGSSNNTTILFDNFSVVPEPSSGVLVLAGAAMVALVGRRVIHS